jgi:hypothetical protein
MISKRRGNLCKLKKRLLASKHELGTAGLLTSSPTDEEIAMERATKIDGTGETWCR